MGVCSDSRISGDMYLIFLESFLLLIISNFVSFEIK